ncbi:Zinc/iron permease [Trinorchestia longiramus]|nr:Zinc/iron permease [Trinorchestia longiramus]
MDLLTGKIISMLLLGTLSLFFGLIPLKIQKKLLKTDEGKPVETQKKQRRKRDLVVSCLLCFGAGVLLATVFMHMLPETRENIALINKEHYGNDAKHEHLRDDRKKEALMQGTDSHNHGVEGSMDLTSVTSGMITDMNDGPTVMPGVHGDHSHDGEHGDNHVHKRSVEGVGNGDQNPSLANTTSSSLDVDTTDRNKLGEHVHGNHDHDHAHDHDHEGSGMPHMNDHDKHIHNSEALEFDGSGNMPEAITESLVTFETESATTESAIVPTVATADNGDEPLRSELAGDLLPEGDNHSHDHSGHDHDHDHADNDHDHNHSGPDHAHKKGLTEEKLEGSASTDKDSGSGRSLSDHGGHLHDHNHGPYDRTHANLQHDEHLPHAHDHHDLDGDHDHESKVLPLHRGDNSSSDSIQDFSTREHDSHGHDHHGDHDTHAHAHGEHNHDDEAHAYPIAELLICIGFFFVYFIEEIVHKVVFHKHSHSISKRGSKVDGSMVLKNRHSEEDRIPPVTNGTYRSRSVYASEHPYGGENGSAASGDFNTRASSGTCLPPKDVWPTSGVDNPSFVNENEVEGPMTRVSVTPNSVGHGHSHMADISELKSQDWVSNLRSLIIVLALSFHAVFEGLAVGLQQNVQDVWYLFYAIAAHKLVIAFCVGLELISGGTKTFLTVIYMVVFALVTPLGIAIGIIVTEGTSSPKSFGHMWTVTVLQGIAGGTILYVTFCEVLERERNRNNGRFLKLFALIIGFSTMAIIELVGAHKHSH